MAPAPSLLHYPIIVCHLLFFAELTTGMSASTERPYVSSGKEKILASLTNQYERLNCWLLFTLTSTPLASKFQLLLSSPVFFSAPFCIFEFYIRQDGCLLQTWLVAQDTNRRERDHIYVLLGDIRQVKVKSGVQDEIFLSLGVRLLVAWTTPQNEIMCLSGRPSILGLTSEMLFASSASLILK